MGMGRFHIQKSGGHLWDGFENVWDGVSDLLGLGLRPRPATRPLGPPAWPWDPICVFFWGGAPSPPSPAGLALGPPLDPLGKKRISRVKGTVCLHSGRIERKQAAKM